MLRIVETLIEFQTILLGQRLEIYTNNKDIACNFINSDRLLIRRLTFEEYGPEIEYT